MTDDDWHLEYLDHRRSIPWTLNVTAGHQAHPFARLLRMRTRIQHGMPVAEVDVQRVDQFERDLARLNVVVDYDPANGFELVDRDPERDAPDAIVRAPTRSGPG